MSNQPQTQNLPPQSDPGLRFFIGVRTAVRPDGIRFFAEPQAPERYGAAAAEKYVREKRQAQEQMARRVPISGYISDVAVINGKGEDELKASCPADDQAYASIQLIEFITSSRRTNVSYLSELPDTDDVQVRWFGFDIRDVMAMAALECMRFNHMAKDEGKVKIPAGIWYYRHFTPAPFIDPYETLVPSSMREHVDIGSLCEYLGVPVPPTLGDDPAAKAELARQLALRGQFWPVEPHLM
jgi:hypothetical protein